MKKATHAQRLEACPLPIIRQVEIVTPKSSRAIAHKPRSKVVNILTQLDGVSQPFDMHRNDKEYFETALTN